MKVMVWTLTTDDDSVTTTVHTSSDDAYDTLRKNYASELPEGTSADDLVEYLTEGEGQQGLAFWVEEHEIEVPEAIPSDLRLSFTPDAIREHFEGDEPDPTEGLTDEQLAEVGRMALTDDGLYRAFHDALTWAIKDDEQEQQA